MTSGSNVSSGRLCLLCCDNVSRSKSFSLALASQEQLRNTLKAGLISILNSGRESLLLELFFPSFSFKLGIIQVPVHAIELQQFRMFADFDQATIL